MNLLQNFHLVVIKFLYRGRRAVPLQTYTTRLVSDVVEKTSTRRRSRITCVVVEKIKKVDELSTKILAIHLQQ